MNVVGWIVFIGICGVTIWLAVDTIIWIVKRVKAKKEKKEADKVDDQSLVIKE